MFANNTLNGNGVHVHSKSNGSSDSTGRQLYGGRKADTRLDIIVVGGGIGGLAAALCLAHAGHSITIFEAARKLREVGAGLQISPNVSSLLVRWGMGDALRACAVEPQALVFRRYADGSVVGRTRWGHLAVEEFGAPYYHMHRADLHRILLERTRECPNVSFRLNARVQSIDPHPDAQGKVAISLVSGEIFESDLIVGADGVHSLARQIVCGRADLAQRTGDAAYRAVIPTDAMLRDDDLRSLVETPELTTWMGPDKHIMGYCIRAKQEYNLVMLHPDHGALESYTAEGNADKMREDFANFEIRVRKLLRLVDRTLFWRLDQREPLKTWIHSAGRLLLLGDACHPMLPYRAQGAAMAIEDAAVLGNLLSRLGPPRVAAKHLSRLLGAYEHLRYERATATQETSALNKYIFHLPDGPEQEARDGSMGRAMRAEDARVASEAAVASSAPAPGSDVHSAGSGGSGGLPRARNAANANQWADRKKNDEQFGYDADAAVDGWWGSVGHTQLRRLLGEDLNMETGTGGVLVAVGSPETSTLASSNSRGSKHGKRGFWRRFLGLRGEEGEEEEVCA